MPEVGTKMRLSDIPCNRVLSQRGYENKLFTRFLANEGREGDRTIAYIMNKRAYRSILGQTKNINHAHWYEEGVIVANDEDNWSLNHPGRADEILEEVREAMYVAYELADRLQMTNLMASTLGVTMRGAEGWSEILWTTKPVETTGYYWHRIPGRADGIHYLAEGDDLKIEGGFRSTKRVDELVPVPEKYEDSVVQEMHEKKLGWRSLCSPEETEVGTRVGDGIGG